MYIYYIYTHIYAQYMHAYIHTYMHRYIPWVHKFVKVPVVLYIVTVQNTINISYTILWITFTYIKLI